MLLIYFIKVTTIVVYCFCTGIAASGRRHYVESMFLLNFNTLIDNNMEWKIIGS